jgi:uncharacterized protein (DUF58 family)
VIDRELLAQVRRIQVRTRRLVNDVMTGGYSSVFRGSGIEFDEVREYVDGDDIRSVDWNVTARLGRPFVKTYVEERELTVRFLLDVSASMDFGSRRRADGQRVRRVRDAAAEVCACLALAAGRNNDKVGLVAFSDRIERDVPAKKGSQHLLRLIRDALAVAVGAGGEQRLGVGTDLGVAFDHTLRVQRRRAVLFVVSDWISAVGPDGSGAEAFEQRLRRLSLKHDVSAVVVRDPVQVELPRNAGLLRLRDLETGEDAVVDTSSRRVREAYAERVAARDRALDAVLRRCRVDRIDVRTDRSVADPLVRFFRMRERRGARG